MVYPGRLVRGQILVTCPCGTEFITAQSKIKYGRGKHCSKPCSDRHRARPAPGLKRSYPNGNPGWISPGEVRAGFGADHPNWKGDQVSYNELHAWVRRSKARPTECEHCGSADHPTEWANLSHEYHRDISDWAALCRFCHRAHDSGENYGKAVALFGPNLGRRIA
jgi:hypothetical protein